MDLVSLGFLIVIVLLGGVSAFAADSLGWRIGKRRHSMFGMRPKHFARLVVTITGALIPFATILFLAFASQDVRVWITQGRRAIGELAGVVEQRDQVQRDLVRFQSQARELRTKNEESADQLRAQESRYRAQVALLQKQTGLLDKASGQIAALTPKLRELTQTAARRQKSVDNLTLANQKVQSSLKAATDTLASARDNVTKLRSEFKFVRAEQSQAIQDRDAARAASRVARETYGDIQSRNIQLTQDNLKLEGNITALTAQIADLNAAADEALKASEGARADLATLQGQIQGLESRRDQLQLELNAFKGDAQQTRTQPLTFRAGDELARLVVPVGASVVDARAQINGLLRIARIEADRRGARSTPPGVLPTMRAADLAPLLDGTTATEQIDRLATQIAGGKNDIVLVARAGLNFFEGEAVAVSLKSYPDPVVFQAGEVIAEGRLDSRRGDAGVYAQINEFLGNVVQARAQKAKLIPLRVNGEESYGEVPPEQILEAIRTAGAEPRAYRLQAVATANIRAGDRLKIELRLK